MYLPLLPQTILPPSRNLSIWSTQIFSHNVNICVVLWAPCMDSPMKKNLNLSAHLFPPAARSSLSPATRAPRRSRSPSSPGSSSPPALRPSVAGPHSPGPPHPPPLLHWFYPMEETSEAETAVEGAAAAFPARSGAVASPDPVAGASHATLLRVRLDHPRVEFTEYRNDSRNKIKVT